MFLMKNWIILTDEDIRIFSYEWLWGVSKASRKRWWLFWVWNTRRFHCQGFSIDEPEHQRRRDICQLWTPWCPNSTSSSTFEPATTEVSVSWTVGAINVVRLRKDTGHFLEVESVSVFGQPFAVFFINGILLCRLQQCCKFRLVFVKSSIMRWICIESQKDGQNHCNWISQSN